MKILVLIALVVLFAGCGDNSVVTPQETTYNISTTRSDWQPYYASLDTIGWELPIVVNGSPLVYQASKNYAFSIKFASTTIVNSLPYNWKNNTKTYNVDTERNEQGQWRVVFMPKNIDDVFSGSETVTITVKVKDN